MASRRRPHDAAHIEAHHGLVRALRDAGRLEQSIGAALALTALTPGDPLAHTALSISLQQAGHIPQAEAAAAKARVLEWKIQLQSPPEDLSTRFHRRNPSRDHTSQAIRSQAPSPDA